MEFQTQTLKVYDHGEEGFQACLVSLNGLVVPLSDFTYTSEEALKQAQDALSKQANKAPL